MSDLGKGSHAWHLNQENARLREQLDASQQREAELRTHIERLREAITNELLRADTGRRDMRKALAATPAQSLARLMDQVREECAVVADAWEHGEPIAATIRAMKEAE